VAKRDLGFGANGKSPALNPSSGVTVEDDAMSELNSERMGLLERSVSMDRAWKKSELDIPEPAPNDFALDRFRERIEPMNFPLDGVSGRSGSVTIVVADVYVSADDTLGREGV
jgi:hypothetical protein